MDEDTAMFDGMYGLADDDDNDLFGDGDFDDQLADTSMHDSLMTEQIPTDQDVGNAELANLLGEGNTGLEEGAGFDINTLNERELDIGDKVDDAVDYADIDDDDLADDDDPSSGAVHPTESFDLSGLVESAAAYERDTAQFDDDDDDLFGDGPDDFDNSFTAPALEHGKTDNTQRQDDADSLISDHGGHSRPNGIATGSLAALAERDEEMTEEDQRNFRLQMALLAGTGEEQHGSLEISDMNAWLHIEFPGYDRSDDAPFWNKLLPPKPGKWQGKEPKKPRPIRPTKVTLDIEPDQRTLFTAPTATTAPVERRIDLIHFAPEGSTEQLETLSDLGSNDELPNGLSMQDLELMCTDFETLSNPAEESAFGTMEPQIVGEDVDMSDVDNNDFNSFEHTFKKRRIGLEPGEFLRIHRFDLPSFDDPEKMTARLAREVVLDLNDKKLLVEEVEPDTLKQRSRTGDKPIHATSIKERLAHRFKTSNDAAYNLLQQNQKKVRGQLSNMTIDHSVPAIRLQYPYYQVKLTQKELRKWHRKQIMFKSGIAFSKINKQKRKDFKNKPTREAYARTRDLSVADNSFTLLLEYSEEHPIMLSQTGMGNKIVNYYRKTDSNDPSRPKSDIGDTSVLMPEDKSPFNNFGHIDPGESTLALYNSMYRAPIFKQNQSQQDFLIVREVTGMNGQIHYLRNIDHQYVVGQELPSVTVPGTHSRMVTTASKNRLKAIAFRIARRKKSHRIRVEEVTRHFPDTNDMQNRQKMKEFMVFNKEQKEWEMRNQEPIPDEDELQKQLKPEDICLLESMQVGAQYLADSGYAEDEKDDEDDDKGDENKDLSIEQQLAPWKTTKNFIQATQGKAMLKLHGEGDPSGRGEAFSFIKTSMKGGFKAQGLSISETVGKSKNDAATGGHTYNVAKQQKMYDDSIRQIWNTQKNVLSSQIEPEDMEDEGVDGQIDQVDRARTGVRVTPASGMQTPSGRRRDDETGTSFSKRSNVSQKQQFLKIRRKVWNAREEEWEYKDVIESDPQVIKQYIKRKEMLESSATNLTDLVPTGDPETDARYRKRIEEELARLEKTKQKRPRKKKGVQDVPLVGSPAANGAAGSPNADGTDAPTPAPASSGKQTQATQRKCANCGQVGHIKTNKKLCPLLNGEMSTEGTGLMDSAAFMGAPPSLT